MDPGETVGTADRTRRSLFTPAQRWTVVVFALLLVLLGTWVVGMPRYGAPDEVAHTIKAYATAHGEGYGDAIPGISPLTRYMNAPADLGADDQACFGFHPDVTPACATVSTDPAVRPIPTSAATYPPAYYVLVGGGARILGRDHSLRTYRMLSAALVAALLTAAAARLGRTGRRSPALMLPALTPMAVFMCTAVNPTSIEIAGTLLLWCHLAALHVRREPPDLGHLLIASTIAGVVTLVRPVALPWIALAFATFWFLDRRPIAPDRRTTLRRLTIAAVPLGVAVVASAAWSRYAGVGLTDDKYVDESSVLDVFQQGLGRTGALFEQLLGILGWLDTRIPFPAYVAAAVAIAACATTVWLRGPRRARTVLLALLAVLVLYPAAYVTFARTPLVWQGRYNLPLLGGLTMCAATLLREHGSSRVVDRLARTFVVCFAVAEVLSFHKALQRFMVGTSGDFWLANPSWHPGVNAWVLVALNVVAVVALGVVVINHPRRTTR